jgi:acyl-CoA thioester hydrolase
MSSQQGYILDLPIRLDWSEMDLFGHVNNVAYFKYVQAARVNYLGNIGVNTANPDNKLSFVLAHSSCNYKQPLYFPGEIIVKTKTDWVKNSSMQLNHTIYNEKREVCAEAIDIIVLFDYATHAKVNIPQEMREKVTGNN